MPNRQASEIRSDWSAIFCDHVIQLLNDVEDRASKQKPIDPIHAANQLFDGLLFLQLFDSHVNDEVFPWSIEVLVDTSISGWCYEEDDPVAPCDLDDAQSWITQTVEVYEHKGDVDLWCEPGPRRLHIVQEGAEHLLTIDAADEWWKRNELKNTIVKSLVDLRFKREKEALKQLDTEKSSLIPLAYEMLADDLRDLNATLQSWLENTVDSPLRHQLANSVDRLWLRLGNGFIHLLDVNMADRLWLSELWSDVRWVQRWVELFGDELKHCPQGLMVWVQNQLRQSNVDFSQHPSYVRDPRSLDFGQWAQTATKASRPAATKGVGTRRKNSKLNVNRKMWAMISKDHDRARQLSLQGWADLIGCAKGTVHKTDAWKKLEAYKKMEQTK
ncbi:hypothetical protein [Aeoliella mucimassa]|uniref:Uncharacterized protein n=1 Tax=Aeoliella mucimassa TaxID=2527972 RepID=A0A518APT3_9BACT|nr:hypothetical protein [Aeoliella mucimassa]QDU56733.1 hypothetical protein Pan181_29430 [Aeoliella mucimassa]